MAHQFAEAVYVLVAIGLLQSFCGVFAMHFHNGCLEVVRHAYEAFAADEFRIGVVCLVECELTIDEALCDVVDDAVLEGPMALQPPWVFVVPHANGLSVSCLVLRIGIPTGYVDIVHAAVVEGRAFEFVPFSWGESWCHVADAYDGEFAYLSALDEVLHGLGVPCVSEVEVDGAELVCRLLELDHVPFLAEFVGEWFLADDVFASLDCFLYSACSCVSQGEEAHALHFGVVPEVAFVWGEDGLGDVNPDEICTSAEMKRMGKTEETLLKAIVE